MNFSNKWLGSCHTTLFEDSAPGLTATPDACYLEVANGELIWNTDGYRLIYCAPHAPGGPKHRDAPSLHERVVFMAVCLVLMATFGLWTGARSIAKRALLPSWEGRRPGSRPDNGDDARKKTSAKRGVLQLV